MTRRAHGPLTDARRQHLLRAWTGGGFGPLDVDEPVRGYDRRHDVDVTRTRILIEALEAETLAEGVLQNRQEICTT